MTMNNISTSADLTLNLESNKFQETEYVDEEIKEYLKDVQMMFSGLKRKNW